MDNIIAKYSAPHRDHLGQSEKYELYGANSILEDMYGT